MIAHVLASLAPLSARARRGRRRRPAWPGVEAAVAPHRDRPCRSRSSAPATPCWRPREALGEGAGRSADPLRRHALHLDRDAAPPDRAPASARMRRPRWCWACGQPIPRNTAAWSSNGSGAAGGDRRIRRRGRAAAPVRSLQFGRHGGGRPAHLGSAGPRRRATTPRANTT